MIVTRCVRLSAHLDLTELWCVKWVFWVNITAKIQMFFVSLKIIFAYLNNVFMYTPTKHLRCGEYLSDREKETFTTGASKRQKECLLQYLHG